MSHDLVNCFFWALPQVSSPLHRKSSALLSTLSSTRCPSGKTMVMSGHCMYKRRPTPRWSQYEDNFLNVPARCVKKVAGLQCARTRVIVFNHSMEHIRYKLTSQTRDSHTFVTSRTQTLGQRCHTKQNLI